MFEDCITLYCRSGGEKSGIWHRRLLEGVALQRTAGANIRKTGLTRADKATLYIPGAATGYVSPKEWQRMTETQRTSRWTLQPKDYFVAGAGNYEILRSPAELAERFDEVYTITTVDSWAVEGPLGHWEVGGQ